MEDYNGGVNIHEAQSRALARYPLTALEKDRRMWMVNATGAYIIGFEFMLHIDSADIRRTLGLGAMAAARIVLQHTRTHRDEEEDASGLLIRSNTERHMVDPPVPDIVAAAGVLGTLLIPAVGISHASVDLFRAHSYNRQTNRMKEARAISRHISRVTLRPRSPGDHSPRLPLPPPLPQPLLR